MRLMIKTLLRYRTLALAISLVVSVTGARAARADQVQLVDCRSDVPAMAGVSGPGVAGQNGIVYYDGTLGLNGGCSTCQGRSGRRVPNSAIGPYANGSQSGCWNGLCDGRGGRAARRGYAPAGGYGTAGNYGTYGGYAGGRRAGRRGGCPTCDGYVDGLYAQARGGRGGDCNQCQGGNGCHNGRGGCHQGGPLRRCLAGGCYRPVDGFYQDPRDSQVWAATGFNVPVTVPLAPVVKYQYNYGWGIPSSRLTQVGNRYTQYYPQPFFTQNGGRIPSGAPTVYQPTDTTQQGFYYSHVPSWQPLRRINSVNYYSGW
jgi:hypothetical protein